MGSFFCLPTKRSGQEWGLSFAFFPRGQVRSGVFPPSLSNIFAIGRSLASFFCVSGTGEPPTREMALNRIAYDNQHVTKGCFAMEC